MNHAFLVATFTLFIAATGADEPAMKVDQAKQDLAAIQGTWSHNREESLFFNTLWIDEGRFPHFYDLEASKTIEVSGDKLRYGERHAHEITILLAAKEGKKTISFQNAKEAPIVGVYELKNGLFRICAIDPTLGGGKEGETRLPKACERTRLGWFAQFERIKP